MSFVLESYQRLLARHLAEFSVNKQLALLNVDASAISSSSVRVSDKKKKKKKASERCSAAMVKRYIDALDVSTAFSLCLRIVPMDDLLPDGVLTLIAFMLQPSDRLLVFSHVNKHLRRLVIPYTADFALSHLRRKRRHSHSFVTSTFPLFDLWLYLQHSVAVFDGESGSALADYRLPSDRDTDSEFIDLFGDGRDSDYDNHDSDHSAVAIFDDAILAETTLTETVSSDSEEETERRRRRIRGRRVRCRILESTYRHSTATPMASSISSSAAISTTTISTSDSGAVNAVDSDNDSGGDSAVRRGLQPSLLLRTIFWPEYKESLVVDFPTHLTGFDFSAALRQVMRSCGGALLRVCDIGLDNLPHAIECCAPLRFLSLSLENVIGGQMMAADSVEVKEVDTEVGSGGRGMLDHSDKCVQLPLSTFESVLQKSGNSHLHYLELRFALNFRVELPLRLVALELSSCNLTDASIANCTLPRGTRGSGAAARAHWKKSAKGPLLKLRFLRLNNCEFDTFECAQTLLDLCPYLVHLSVTTSSWPLQSESASTHTPMATATPASELLALRTDVELDDYELDEVKREEFDCKKRQTEGLLLPETLVSLVWHLNEGLICLRDCKSLWEVCLTIYDSQLLDSLQSAASLRQLTVATPMFKELDSLDENEPWLFARTHRKKAQALSSELIRIPPRSPMFAVSTLPLAAATAAVGFDSMLEEIEDLTLDSVSESDRVDDAAIGEEMASLSGDASHGRSGIEQRLSAGRSAALGVRNSRSLEDSMSSDYYKTQRQYTMCSVRHSANDRFEGLRIVTYEGLTDSEAFTQRFVGEHVVFVSNRLRNPYLDSVLLQYSPHFVSELKHTTNMFSFKFPFC